MKCKNCGGIAGPGETICPYCGLELEEREKVYIDRPVYVYNTPPAPDGLDVRRMQERLNVDAAKSLVLAILSLVFGLVLMRSVLAAVSLVISTNVTKEAKKTGLLIPTTLTIAKTLAIISLCCAVLLAIILTLSYLS